jgi:hypothetical protein
MLLDASRDCVVRAAFAEFLVRGSNRTSRGNLLAMCLPGGTRIADNSSLAARYTEFNVKPDRSKLRGIPTMTDQLTEIEAIKQLKSRYFRLMDTQQFDDWHIKIEGCAALVAGVRGLMTGAQSIHQGYMPEIELTSATTATGIWSMYDQVRLPTCIFEGWGHYHEEYVKENGEWKIKSIHLTRLHTEENWI